MNRKTTYLIPAFAAVFALMFAVATPLAMAEYGEGMHDKGMGQKNHKMHKVIEVEGFVGSIQITENTDRQALKDQVTVSLSEAADGLDVMGGHIGVVTNENDDKFLAWTLKSVQKDSESETAIAIIHIVDAGDAENTTTVTKEFDRSNWNGKFNHDGDKRAGMMEKIQQKLFEPTGDADVDAARSTFVEKLQELDAALESEDSERASELRDELKDLRSELGNIRLFGR
ncbi:MAG: hypothetical protein GKS07_08080 [Nitrosopumilus sp.]|nr:MAG: hypothetical protein GKS07_08080 [Nitrosopumilus sp.]